MYKNHSHKNTLGRKWITIFLLSVFHLFITACHSEDADLQTYPSIVTEFVNLTTNEQGTATLFRNDKGTEFRIENQITDLLPNAVYRIICGYEVTDTHSIRAIIYKVGPVKILAEQESAHCDALHVVSLWTAGDYINLHLAPMTQTGEHEWGFYHASTINGNHQDTYHIELVHRQHDDPAAYTTHLYASIYLPQLENIEKGDSIYLHIHTFEGRKTWGLKY